MKNLGNFLVINVVFFLFSCRSEYLLNVPTNIPCTGKQLTQTDDFFRETGIGESVDHAGSIEKANTNAQKNLARKLSARVKVAIKYYTTDAVEKERKRGRIISNQTAMEYQELLKSELVSNSYVMLNEVGTVCQETYSNFNKSVFKTYITIEISKDGFYLMLSDRTRNINKNYEMSFDKSDFISFMNGKFKEFQSEYDKEYKTE